MSEEVFSKTNPAKAVLNYIKEVTINTLGDEVAHLDICINFFYAPVSIILFEALVEKGLQVIIFDKNGVLVNNIKLSDINKINKVVREDSIFLSFSERKVCNKKTIVSCFVPVGAGYKIFFFYPGDEPASIEFQVLSTSEENLAERG